MRILILSILFAFNLSAQTLTQVDASKWQTSGTNIYKKNTLNVGIGTATPTQILDVNGNTRLREKIEMQPSRRIGAGLDFGNPTEVGSGYLEFYNVASGNTSLVNTTTFASITLHTNNLERLRILSNGNLGVGTTNPTSTFQVVGSFSESVTIITATTTLTNIHNKILVNNAATNITINLPDAASCLGRKYEISRYAGSTGTITIQSIGNQIQSLIGTIGALSSISAHSATGGGLSHSFTAVSVGGVSVWVRL